MRAAGFHEFAEFVAEDVGTVDSGLNSMVLANNNEMVLLPVNEPTFGTRRKSQIQTYLEQNEGPGLQHMALKTGDIVTTLRKVRRAVIDAGFDESGTLPVLGRVLAAVRAGSGGDI
jgi:4-hydroxyphenylpyruvate dioxygenase